MYKDDSGILSLDQVEFKFHKCFNITNTSVQNLAVRISSVLTLPKRLRELKQNQYTFIIFIDVLTLCDSDLSKIL